MVRAIGGLQKCPKFGCSGHTFGGCWLLLFFMIVSTQKHIQLIIQSLPCSTVELAIGGLTTYYWYYTVSTSILLLLITFECFFWHSIAHIAHLRHFCILCTCPKSCFGGLNEQSGYLVIYLFFSGLFDTSGSMIPLSVSEILALGGFCDGRGQTRTRNWVF